MDGKALGVDIRQCGIDERDLVVLEVIAGEHGFLVIASSGDGLVPAWGFRVEIILDG